MGLLSSPTAQQLITETRIMLNQQDPGNSFWKDDELLIYLNEGIRIYFTELVSVNEGDFVTTANLDIVGGTETVTLPTDFFKVRALYKKQSDGYILLPYRNNLTEGYLTNGAATGDLYLPYYYFRANQLVLRPIPVSSDTAGLKLEYIQFPETLVWGGDTMSTQISPLFKQIIVMYAVYKAKLKESMVNGVAMYKVPQENLAELYKNFKDTIAIRSKNPTFVIPYNPETDGI